ncbi:MAG: hypothetical protein AB1942_14215 [Pseudomonadota bacterium]
MSPRADHDELARARLSVLGQELETLAKAIGLAVAGAGLPWPLSDVFIRLAAAAEVCERLLADHAAGVAGLSLTTVGEIAEALRLVREINTSLVGLALAGPEPPRD